MRELVVQAANDTNTTTEDRANIQKEISQLQSEINRIASTTQFNTKNLLDGTASGLVFQIGANESQIMTLTIAKMNASALGVSGINVATDAVTTITGYITTIDNAINQVSGERAKLGAVQNRLEHTINNLSTASENLTAAESRIRDTDMAKEMMEFTKNNILQQAATAMLAQANAQPQTVLQLLK